MTAVRLFSVLSVLSSLHLPGAAFAQCHSYAVEVFQGPSCGIFGYPAIAPQSINEQGTIVGYRSPCALQDDDRAFWWTAGPTAIDLPTDVGQGQCRAFGINSNNQIVGSRDLTQGPSQGRRAFLFQNGTYTDLGSVLNSTEVEASAINDSGVITGYSNNSIVGPLRAFRWDQGLMTTLVLPLRPYGVGRDINNQGVIVGWMGPSATRHPFLWYAGESQDLGLPSGAYSADAIAVSDSGRVAGHYFIEVSPGINRKRGFHWKDGTYTIIEPMPGTEVVNVSDINDRGEIVGWCALPNGGNMVPFIWREGVMTDLRTLVPLPDNFTLNEAWAINDQGQIAAGGRDYNTSPVSSPGFRLTPVSKVPGDYDCNHIVDIDDLLGVIAHWGPTPGGGNAPADFNRDGTVNVADLLTVVLHWTP